MLKTTVFLQVDKSQARQRMEAFYKEYIEQLMQTEEQQDVLPR